MNLKTRYNLWTAKTGATPRANFKYKLKNKLSAAYNVKYGTPAFNLHFVTMKFGAGLAVVLVAVSVMGTGAYAYNSSAVVSGDILYPVKTVIEKIQESTKKTPEEQAKFYLKTLARREAEMKYVAEHGQKKSIKKINQTDAEMRKWEEKLAEADGILEGVLSEDEGLITIVRQRLSDKFEKRKQAVDGLMGALQSAEDEDGVDFDENEWKIDEDLFDEEDEEDDEEDVDLINNDENRTYSIEAEDDNAEIETED